MGKNMVEIFTTVMKYIGPKQPALATQLTYNFLLFKTTYPVTGLNFLAVESKHN